MPPFTLQFVVPTDLPADRHSLFAYVQGLMKSPVWQTSASFFNLLRMMCLLQKMAQFPPFQDLCLRFSSLERRLNLAARQLVYP